MLYVLYGETIYFLCILFTKMLHVYIFAAIIGSNAVNLLAIWLRNEHGVDLPHFCLFPYIFLVNDCQAAFMA